MARAVVHVNHSDRPITPDPDDGATSLSYAWGDKHRNLESRQTNDASVLL